MAGYEFKEKKKLEDDKVLRKSKQEEESLFNPVHREEVLQEVSRDEGAAGEIAAYGNEYLDFTDEFVTYEEMMDQLKNKDKKELEDIMALKMRTAINMKENFVHDDRYSVEATKEETEKIKDYLNRLESGDLQVEDKEAVIAKLETIVNRNEAHLLMNAQKSGGDSKYMKKVKSLLATAEFGLSREYPSGMSMEDMQTLGENYRLAIDACQTYLAHQGSLIKAWTGRKTMVREMMQRLKKEAELINMGTLLFGKDKPKGVVISSGRDLLTIARAYELGKEMKVHRKDVGEPHTKVPTMSIDAAKKQLKGLDVDDAAAKDVLALLKSGTISPSVLFKSSVKSQGDLSDKEMKIITEMAALNRQLSEFKDGETKVVITYIGSQQVRLIQKEDNSLNLLLDSTVIDLGSVEKVKREYQDDIVANEGRIYGDTDLVRVIDSFAGNYTEKNTAELVRGRRFMTEIMTKRTGMKKSDFENVPFETLVFMTRGYVLKTIPFNTIKEKCQKANEEKALSVNTQAELELSSVNNKGTSKVDYNVTYKEKENQWTKTEEELKNIVAELIYFEDTVAQDKFYQDKKNFKEDGTLTDEAKAIRFRDVLVKNKGALASLVHESYQNKKKKDARIKENEERKKDGKDPLPDFVPEPTILEKLFDRLPMFMMGDEELARSKKEVQGALNEMVEGLVTDLETKELAIDETLKKEIEDIDKGFGFELMKSIKRAAAKTAADVKKLPIKTTKEALEEGGGKLETAIILKLMMVNGDKEMNDSFAKKYDEMNEKTEELKKCVSDLMEECTNLFFGEEKKEEKKEEEKKEEVQEQEQDEDFQIEGEVEVIKADEIKVDEEALAREREAEEAKRASDHIAEIRARMQKREEEKLTYKQTMDKLMAKQSAINKENKSLPEDKQKSLTGEDVTAFNKARDSLNNMKPNEAKELQQTLNDVAKGKKGQGAYLKNVMKSYFNGLSDIDKRSMIASAIRCAKPLKKTYTMEAFKTLKDEEKMDVFGEFLGGMFKGAGPLFQKLLQGLPVGAIPKGLQKSVDDMKDSLAPIPENIVKERLDAIVTNSNGKIERIEVNKSLGAASVGQAFLCKMFGPDYPEGKEVVIKVLRPDVRNRMAREKSIMENAAIEVDTKDAGYKDMTKPVKGGMYATFQGTYKRIEEELDLTLEAKNIERGQVYNDQSKNSKYVKKTLKVMQMDKDVNASSDTLVLEKAPGTTAKSYMNDTRNEMFNAMHYFYKSHEDKNGNIVYDEKDGAYEYKEYSILQAEKVIEAKDKLEKLIVDTEKRQKYMLEICDTWAREGVFKGGFYHGDLHAGNIMLDDNGATIIDFGNATQLTKDQINHVTRMMLAAGQGDVEIFLDGFKNLLENTDAATWEKKKEECEWVFKEVLSLGAEKDTALRISVALLKAQEIGLELPPAISNFANSQIRLQNAVDDMNRLLMELKKARADLDELKLGTPENYRAVKKGSLEYQYHDMIYNLTTPKDRYDKLLEFQTSLGMKNADTKAGFMQELADKSKRAEFIKKNVSPHTLWGEVQAYDIYLKNLKNASPEERLPFLQDEYNPEAATPKFYEKLKKWRFEVRHEVDAKENERRQMAVSKFDSGIDAMNTEVRQKDYKTSDEGFVKYLENAGVDKELYAQTEYDKAVSAYFEAQDKGESAEELDKLAEKVWVEKEKLESNKGVDKIRKEHDEIFDSMIKIRHFTTLQDMQSANANNSTRVKYMRNILTPFFDEPEFGGKLKAKFEAYVKFRKEIEDNATKAMAENPVDEYVEGPKDNEVEYPREKELYEMAEELKELSWSAQYNKIKGMGAVLEAESKKIRKPYVFNEKKDEPDNFFDVMGDVISRHKYDAFGRYGFKKSAGLMFELVGSTIKGWFSKS